MTTRTSIAIMPLFLFAEIAAAQPISSAFVERPAPNSAQLLLAASQQPLPRQAPPALPVAPNPAAPPGFNAPSPTYNFEESNAGIGVPGRFWASGEWLYWATSGQSLPALATASPVGTAASLAGVLGSPNTATLFGDRRANQDFRNGYRLNAGWWLDDDRTLGVEGDFFFLQNSANAFAASSDGSQIIARPFVNALTGRPDAALVSFPGLVAGSLTARAENQVIGGGINGIGNILGGSSGRVDFLIGYRYLNVSDEVHLREDATALTGQGAFAPGLQLQSSDRFATANNFHGGLIGLAAEKQCGILFFGARASVALGANVQSIDINGSTLAILPGNLRAATVGGLLATPANIGHFTRTAFAVLPEANLRAGIQLSQQARVFAGYNFLYLSNVVRAGDQIFAPTSSPKTTDFWAQGFSLGLDLRF
ncbi:MAG TPA: BBP7 family outer membrane beta-barrel protein [Urbifossiella sp.]|nr:BBP7 family outer membrane beta-barrel protein [Urbifossiella sp.]